MKTRILYLLIIIATAGTSCNKWLDQQPQDGVVSDNFWKTKEQVQAAVIGSYASLLGAPAGVSDRSLAETLFLWGELRADMLAPATSITADERDVINVNILSTNAIANWSAVYRTINYCNTVIDKAPQVLEYDKTFTEKELNGYLAEAKGLRSLLYFYLVRSFGDVPLVLKSTDTDEDIAPIAKSSAANILDQLVTDLTDAAQHAVESYGTAQCNAGRLTKYGIQTILADVYLWMEKYQQSIDVCDKIIAANKFALVPGNSGWFTTLYYNGNSTECIFEFQFDAQKLNPFYNVFAGSRKRYSASEKVMEDIYTVDYNDESQYDLRGAGAAVRTSDNSIWKYIGLNATTIRQQDASYAHWFVYRYADVLLMKAEACAQVNRVQEALNLVKIIRDRAHALPATARNPLPTDASEVAVYVLEERGREFAFEGKRWYDVLRHAKRNNYANISWLLNMVAGTVPAERQQSALVKYQDYDSHYFPVPQAELSKNSLLTQNPFYE